MPSFDTYGINKKYILSALILNIVVPIGLAIILGIYLISPISDKIGEHSSYLYNPHIISLIIIACLLILDIAVNRRFDVIYTNVFLYAYIIGYIGYGIYYILSLIVNSPLSTSHPGSYENFADVNGTLQQVQKSSELLQKSLDTLTTATDDTCAVMKGIEKKYLDNATSPSGDGENPPSPAEAKELKVQAMPGAIKKWNQEKQDWAATRGKVPIVECFADGSLSDLITANQQLSDLLESAPVQKVLAQVKSLETSRLFAEKYINQLASKLAGESFDNPTSSPSLEDTIATSNKLMKRSTDIQSKIKEILESTKTLNQNYNAMNAKANDPNTVNNLAAAKS